MKRKTNLAALLFILLFSFTATFANSIYSAASDAVTAKLQENLADSRIEMKISKAQTYQISKKLIGLKGEGTAEGLTIKFDVQINKSNFTPTSVKYVIKDNYLDSSNLEDNLSRQLLNKINSDLKTTNIVIAIDSFSDQSNIVNQSRTVGSGEISINAEWKKIKFEVIENNQTKKVLKVNYQIF